MTEGKGRWTRLEDSERRRSSITYGYLHMGQVTLFELLQHSQRPLLVKLPQSIDGPFVQVGVSHQTYKKQNTQRLLFSQHKHKEKCKCSSERP